MRLRAIWYLILFFSFGQSTYCQSLIEIIDESKSLFLEAKEPRDKAKIAGDISYYYSTISADSSQKYGEYSLNFALEAKNDTLIAQAYNDLATVFLVKGQYDVSLEYCRKSYKIREALNDEAGIASLYVKLGNNFYKTTQYDSAMHYFLKGRDYYQNVGNTLQAKTIESNISTIYQSLGNYEKAIAYLESPNQYFDSVNAYLNLSNNLINLANIQVAMGDTSEAISTYARAEEACKLGGNYFALGALYNNLGETYFHLGDLKKATDLITQSLELRKSQGYQGDLFSSYLTLGLSYFRQGAYTEAKPYLLWAANGLESAGISDKLSSAYKHLSIIYAFERNRDSLNIFLEKSTELNHQTIITQVRELTQELEEKYQSAQKDKALLEQEQTLQARELKLQRQTIWLISILGIVLILVVVLYYVYRQKQAASRQAALERELADERERTRIQEERLRISRELHDNIGSYLSVIKVSVERLPVLPAEKIRQNLPELQESLSLSMRELRKTVWLLNNEQVSLDALAIRLRDFFKPFQESGSQISVTVTGNNYHSLKDIQATHLFRVLQEAVHNAYRHGKATEIEVKLEGRSDGSVAFSVKDNGIGFSADQVESGNGLQNMRSRMADLNGEMHIQSTPEEGTLVEGYF
jgi:signal transduction histidine kinase